MPNDIERLKQFEDRLIELNKLNQQLSEEEGFDTVSLDVQPGTMLSIRYENKDNRRSEVSNIPFSMIDGLDERARKKIERRQKKLNKDEKQLESEESK
ncbi:hypothetical protein ES707_11015 [subsurface metagenome]